MIVLLEEPSSPAPASAPAPPPLSSFIGSCKGQFRSAEEADAYLRELRDEWERP